MGPEFFLQTLLGLVINEVWDFTIDKIKKVYKEHKEVPEKQKTFQSRMYTAIIDAFCVYTGVNPDEAQDDVMDFICRTALEYYDQSYKKQDTTTDTLLSAINTLESRFGNTLLVKKDVEDKQKISVISDFLQVYIANDPGFRHIYVVKSLDDLKNKGQQYEEKQLDLKLFAEALIEKAVHHLAVLIKQGNDRVIEELKQDNKEQTNILLAAIKKSLPYVYYEASSIPKDINRKFDDSKKEYVDKWNERLFLHRKPGDKALTLKNTFIMPQYTYGNSDIKSRFRLDYVPDVPTIEKSEEREKCDDLESLLENFYIQGKSLLIIGYPGIGKSSVLCFLADKYINDSDVLFLKFSDWSEKELIDLYRYHGSLLLNAITTRFNCSKKELENKMLILDGFDELQTQNYDPNVLNNFIAAVRGIKNFKFIITSREGYIYNSTELFETVITLSYFSHKQIKMYALAYKAKENS